MVCDKQVRPTFTQFCNFSKIASELSEDNKYLLEGTGCVCRLLLHQSCQDLVNGHIVTTNYNYIKNIELKKLFYYGAMFKENLSQEYIIESITKGLDEYIKDLLNDESNIPNAADLQRWKTLILEKCLEELHIT